MRGVAIHFINADPYKLKFLKESMARLGVDVELKDFRQGFLTYASAVDAFEAAALDGKLVHGADPVLTMAISNVTVERPTRQVIENPARSARRAASIRRWRRSWRWQRPSCGRSR